MDMVSLNIAGGILASICRDMGVTLMRTSYSTIFSESLDFTCALALPSGEMIATGDFCPAMIGGMPLLIRSCVNEIAVEDLGGDVILHNDPYRGSTLTPSKPVSSTVTPIGFSVLSVTSARWRYVAGGFAGEAASLSRRSAGAAGQDQKGWQGCRRYLAHPARQCAYAVTTWATSARRRHRSW